MLKLFYRS